MFMYLLCSFVATCHIGHALGTPCTFLTTPCTPWGALVLVRMYPSNHLLFDLVLNPTSLNQSSGRSPGPQTKVSVISWYQYLLMYFILQERKFFYWWGDCLQLNLNAPCTKLSWLGQTCICCAEILFLKKSSISDHCDLWAEFKELLHWNNLMDKQ